MERCWGLGMRKILLFGAGKSATCLIDYLIKNATIEDWHVTIADADQQLIESKTGTHSATTAVALDIHDNIKRKQLIADADIVISLMPPTLHFIIATDCVELNKNLLTASYLDDEMKKLEQEINDKNLLFICEMGLDPGIDHMSAMQLIHQIQLEGGTITSFKSHCGGLIAPESDDNPWHYKISWNPRNVVMAGKAGAIYKVNGSSLSKKYEEIFGNNETIELNDLGKLAWYPNRNSITYGPIYNLEDCATFIRTTLRYPQFCSGWKNIIDLRLTNESDFYDTDDLSIAAFYKQHFSNHSLNEKVEQLLNNNPYFKKQLQFLGIEDNSTIINKGKCTTADILQFILEKKLELHQHDKDMIVMVHEIEYLKDDTQHKITSSLVVKGEDHLRTAMAKTVGLPLGIAAKLILNHIIKLKGLHIPISEEIYQPVLNELNKNGIRFNEKIN